MIDGERSHAEAAGISACPARGDQVAAPAGWRGDRV